MRGFTLIETMLVVAIVAILAGIALPAYQQQVRAARRADACAVLLQARQLMERYYSRHYTYASAPSTTVPSRSPLDGTESYYQVEISSQSATGFTIVARPLGGQQGDACGALGINQAGEKTVGGLTVDKCWR